MARKKTTRKIKVTLALVGLSLMVGGCAVGRVEPSPELREAAAACWALPEHRRVIESYDFDRFGNLFWTAGSDVPSEAAQREALDAFGACVQSKVPRVLKPL